MFLFFFFWKKKVILAAEFTGTNAPCFFLLKSEHELFFIGLNCLIAMTKGKSGFVYFDDDDAANGEKTRSPNFCFHPSPNTVAPDGTKKRIPPPEARLGVAS